MRKETLKDLAKPILTEDEIKIRQDEVAKVLQIVSKLRDKKNPLLEEKEELRDLIEKALEHQIVSNLLSCNIALLQSCYAYLIG